MLRWPPAFTCVLTLIGSRFRKALILPPSQRCPPREGAHFRTARNSLPDGPEMTSLRSALTSGPWELTSGGRELTSRTQGNDLRTVRTDFRTVRTHFRRQGAHFPGQGNDFRTVGN